MDRLGEMIEFEMAINSPGWVFVQARGYPFGHLIVSREHKGSGWVITHIATGLKIGPPLMHRREAVRMVQMIGDWPEWGLVKRKKKNKAGAVAMSEATRIKLIDKLNKVYST